MLPFDVLHVAVSEQGEDRLVCSQRDLLHAAVVALEVEAQILGLPLEPLALALKLGSVPVLLALHGEGAEADHLLQILDHPLAVAGQEVTAEQAGGEPGVGGRHGGARAEGKDAIGYVRRLAAARYGRGRLLEEDERLRAG